MTSKHFSFVFQATSIYPQDPYGMAWRGVAFERQGREGKGAIQFQSIYIHRTCGVNELAMLVIPCTLILHILAVLWNIK
jgi:hypothetical protein